MSARESTTNKIRQKGQDTADALRAWVADEIKTSHSARPELGRFFFGVSSATLGILAIAQQAGGSFRFEWLHGAFLLSLLASGVVAIRMAIPRRWTLDPETDLYDEYNRHTRATGFYVWTWLISWLASVAFGILGLIESARLPIR